MKISDHTVLTTESDVEQKRFIWFLNSSPPRGLGHKLQSIRTKPNLRGFTIDKGKSAHVYFPDYIVMSQGLPMIVAEVKKPGGDLDVAYREARLYAAELNAHYPADINPVRFVLVANDSSIRLGFWDELDPRITAAFSDDPAMSSELRKIADRIEASALKTWADETRRLLCPQEFWKPTVLLGGQSVRNEEIAPNSFGTALALDYKHLFNPTTYAERSFIVRNAYITSKRRERYVDPIDKIIRAAAPPSEARARLIEDTEAPKEIIERLRDTQRLANQVILLVGGVGSGKSTFVDYLREVKLPPDLRGATAWLGLDMNFAPLDKGKIYDWVLWKIVDELKRSNQTTDFDSLEVIEKVYSQELRQLKKGALQLLNEESPEYRSRLADYILSLQKDPQKTANAMLRFAASERGKLPIVVFDNCDKRERNDQLLMFEVAQWLRSDFKVLVMLPLRDETYDNHRSEPPLDTAIKDLVFRIEPPMFSKVLMERIKLTLREMQRVTGKSAHSYVLPNDMRVEYPDTELAYYLSCIVRSVFEYDKFVRRVIMGLAGRDLRKAMEIFLEFCTSGHIDTAEVFKIRQNQGNYTLPYPVVARVLLLGNRRFYDSGQSYIKNLFSCDKDDSLPTYFARYSIVEWLAEHFRVSGPNGLKGYHPVSALKLDLMPLGFGDYQVQREIEVLVKAGCVVAEHLRHDVADDDLVKLAPSGFVHRTLATNVEYLGSVAEDTWFSTRSHAQSIADRIGDRKSHYQRQTTLLNARALVGYLGERLKNRAITPEVVISGRVFDPSEKIQQGLTRCSLYITSELASDPWLEATELFPKGRLVTGKVVKHVQGGILVDVGGGLVGFLRSWGKGDFAVGAEIEVVIDWVNVELKRMGLRRKRRFRPW